MPESENTLAEVIFDKIGVMERVDNDIVLLKELVEIFFTDYKINISQIKSALANSDGKFLQEKSHFIKSALGNLGAMAAYHTAEALEQKGKANELVEAKMLLVQLEYLVEKYKEEVTEFLIVNTKIV